MKRNLLPPIVDGLLAALLTFGSLGCLVTGFSLTVSAGTFFIGVLLWTAAFTLCWNFRRGWIAALGLLVLYGVWAYLTHTQENLLVLLRSIGGRYYHAYGIDLLGLFRQVPAWVYAADVTKALTALTVPMCALVSLGICRRWPVSLCLPVVLLPLVLTLITTDSAASTEFICLMLLGLGLLLLTQGVRHRSAREGAKLTGMLVLPLVLAISLLIGAVPRAGYTPPDLVDRFLAWLTDSPDFTLPTIDVGGSDPSGTAGPVLNSKVDLGNVGPNNQAAVKIMEVTYTVSDVVYLRGRSYADYLGRSWTNDSQPKKDVFSLAGAYRVKDSRYEDVLQQLTVTTEDTFVYQYLPYYSPWDRSLTDGSVINTDGTQWTYEVAQLDSSWRNAAAALELRYMPNYITETKEMFAQLPVDTQIRAQAHLDRLGITGTTTLAEAMELIGAYVRNSAEYSLNTGFMPEEDSDFALWFLENSDTGYCIHYASAATVLLRAAGIPARYVEGYTVSVDEPYNGGFRATVTGKMAHAWTEVYVPKVGWVILEATPSGGYDAPPASTGATTPTPPTAPTGQTQSSAPTAPTVPTESASGTQPPQSTAASTQSPSTQSGAQPESGFTVPAWVWITLAGVLGGCALLVLQWLVRLRLRYAWLYRGGTNAQALKLWRYARYVGRLTGTPPPEDLKALAQKAKFSQYTLTADEIGQFDGWLAQTVTAARGRNGFLQAVYRLIFALY